MLKEHGHCQSQPCPTVTSHLLPLELEGIGFHRPLFCASLSGYPASKASGDFSAQRLRPWPPHLRDCTASLGLLALEPQVQWPHSRRGVDGDRGHLLPTPAHQPGADREIPLRVHPWPLAAIPVGPPLFWPLPGPLGGPTGPTLCCCFQAALSTSRPWRPQDPAKN